MKILKITEDHITLDINGKEWIVDRASEITLPIECFDGFDEANTCMYCDGTGSCEEEYGDNTIVYECLKCEKWF